MILVSYWGFPRLIGPNNFITHFFPCPHTKIIRLQCNITVFISPAPLYGRVTLFKHYMYIKYVPQDMLLQCVSTVGVDRIY